MWMRDHLLALACAILTVSSSALGYFGLPESPPRIQTIADSTADVDTLLSAAFGELARADGAYGELHHQHLGVTQPAPDPSSCPAWPEVEPGDQVIRLGFVEEEPLHVVDDRGRHVGFEADLATELLRRINAHYSGARVVLEWVRIDLELPIGPAKNAAIFNVLADGLRAGQFDVAFSSVIPVPAPDVTYLCPTMTMFPGVVYTGLGDLDVSGIRDRDSLVEFLASHPGMTFVHGMGVSVYDRLAEDVAAAGGSIAVAPAGSLPHFRMADISGLSKRSAGTADLGVLLDVNPRTDVMPKAVFALTQ